MFWFKHMKQINIKTGIPVYESSRLNILFSLQTCINYCLYFPLQVLPELFECIAMCCHYKANPLLTAINDMKRKNRLENKVSSESWCGFILISAKHIGSWSIKEEWWKLKNCRPVTKKYVVKTLSTWGSFKRKRNNSRFRSSKTLRHLMLDWI